MTNRCPFTLHCYSFTLTLIDTLDTLALLGKYDEFEAAIRLVTSHTSFDTDVVVSVFETNIRILR